VRREGLDLDATGLNREVWIARFDVITDPLGRGSEAPALIWRVRANGS